MSPKTVELSLLSHVSHKELYLTRAQGSGVKD